MPVVDGLASIKLIRSLERAAPLPSRVAQSFGRVPVFVISGMLRCGDSERTYVDAGFDGWMPKPVDMRKLGTYLAGAFDPAARRQGLYDPNHFAVGGWFDSDSNTDTDTDTALRTCRLGVPPAEEGAHGQSSSSSSSSSSLLLSLLQEAAAAALPLSPSPSCFGPATNMTGITGVDGFFPVNSADWAMTAEAEKVPRTPGIDHAVWVGRVDGTNSMCVVDGDRSVGDDGERRDYGFGEAVGVPSSPARTI